MFQVIYAPEWMNDAHEYEMQVQLGKNNTRGVTQPLLLRLLPPSLYLAWPPPSAVMTAA